MSCDHSLARFNTITAVLGATNTGKTHYAVERLLAHKSGIIGLPLRLLAREIYDRLIQQVDKNTVALITGEEKILPKQARYYVCTVESMPLDLKVECVAIDEIQLCEDLDRGYIFTDRLLHARGTKETLFMGALTMQERLRALVPGVQFMVRERMSKLSYAGRKKLSRLPRRSAIVAFSADNVYGIAELLRRQKGGAAIVMGALSPRTRNAQVALYQNGDVDHIVATDAIGMGLNMDIHHVAFAGLAKYDGHRHRRLMPQELGQIAGRAGRYMRDGTFGLTADAGELDELTIEAIQESRFAPVKTLQWRNPQLNYATLYTLLRSLETAPPPDSGFVRARDADDSIALRTLITKQQITDACHSVGRVKLFWDVCQIPDFRKTMQSDHTDLIEQVFWYLSQDAGHIPEDWMHKQIQGVNQTQGNIDALSKRLAYIRTFTYIANRSHWLTDPLHWRETTRKVEDTLSDALHARLTEQFIDRRTHLLVRRMKQKEILVTEVHANDQVTVEGQTVGHLDGFRFIPAPAETVSEGKALRSIGSQALQEELSRRVDKFYGAPDTELEITEQGGLMWGECAVGLLEKGHDILVPKIKVFTDESLHDDIKAKAKRRLEHFVFRRIDTLFEPLLTLKKDETVTGLARGIAFQLIEHLGILPRLTVLKDMKQLSQEERAPLRKFGIRFGQYNLFMPAILKPAPTRLRLILWSVFNKFAEYPAPPPAGLVAVPTQENVPNGYHEMAGYKACGARAIRVDILERLADMIRKEDVQKGFEASQDMLSMTGSTHESFAALMEALKYTAEKRERPKAVKPPFVEKSAEGQTPTPDGAESEATGTAEDVQAEAMMPTESSAPETPSEASGETVEMESYYIFLHTPQKRTRHTPKGAPNSGHKAAHKPRKKLQANKPKSAKPEKKVDPDSPFAVLQQLKQ